MSYYDHASWMALQLNSADNKPLRAWELEKEFEAQQVVRPESKPIKDRLVSFFKPFRLQFQRSTETLNCAELSSPEN